MRIRKKVLWLLVFLLSPFLITFAFRLFNLFEAYSRMNSFESMPTGPALARATVDISSANTYLGRASFFLSSNTLATNAHVIKKYCESLPQSTCVGQKLIISQLSEPNLKLPLRVKASTCSLYLDVCLFAFDDSAMLDRSAVTQHDLLSVDSSPGDKIFSVTNPRSQEKMSIKVMEGTLLFHSRTIGITKLYSKRGMSGSPILGEGSHILGIATSNVDNYPLFFALFNYFIQSVSRPTYKPITFMVPTDAVQTLAKCLDPVNEDCRSIQQSLFLTMLDDYKAAIKSDSVDNRLRIALRRELKEKIERTCGQDQATSDFSLEIECVKANSLLNDLKHSVPD